MDTTYIHFTSNTGVKTYKVSSSDFKGTLEKCMDLEAFAKLLGDNNSPLNRTPVALDDEYLAYATL